MNNLLVRLVLNGLSAQNSRLISLNRVNKVFYHKLFCFGSNTGLSRAKLPIKRTTIVSFAKLSTAKTATDLKTTSHKTVQEVESQSLKTKKRSLRKKAVHEKSEQHLPVLAFSTAEEYNMDELILALKEQGLYEIAPFTDEVDDVLHLTAKYEINHSKRELFIFRGFDRLLEYAFHRGIKLIGCHEFKFLSIQCEAVLKFLKPFEDSRYDQTIIEQEQEQMSFELVNAKSKLQRGLIHLNNKSEGIESDLEKYAFSNAIALSVKLSIWESLLDRYIDSIEFVSQDMKTGGKLRLTRDQVFRKTGELFDLKHHINLSSDLLDIPDFYWDREELEKLFSNTLYFLNIRKRTNVMNEKLNHCIELMELLATHLNDKHSTKLEWMIIILIMVEVVFEFIHYAERLF